MFLFSDLKPAVRVRSVKLMDWIDSQQWLLQLEDESPHHFLSFPTPPPSTAVSSFFCSPPSIFPSFHPHIQPPLQFSPSAVPPSRHLINICLGFSLPVSSQASADSHVRARAVPCAVSERSGKADDWGVGGGNGTSMSPRSCCDACK